MGRKKAGKQDLGPEKKGKKKWIVFGVIAFLVVAAAVGGNNKQDEQGGQKAEPPTASAEHTTSPTEQPVEDTTEQPAEEVAEAEGSEYKLEHGELVSAITNEIDGRSVLVVKAKISSSYNNTATVDQNYYNVADLIQSQGCDSFDEIQYWAVADMSDGSEQKVVAFTIDADLIQKIAAGQVVTNKLGDYVTDLYILPSLTK